jgi:hypothetical protein
MDCRRMPEVQKGGRAMNYVRLSPEEQRRVCEDLLAVEQADRLDELVALRRQMLSEHRPAVVWQQIAADRLAREASSLIGGPLWMWRDAAAAAVGITSRADVCIEAVCRVAEDVQWKEPQRAAPPARLSIGNRKRGSR